MTPTTQVTLITAILTSLFTVLPIACAAYLKLQEVLKPWLARRRLRLILLCTPETRVACGAFLASLRGAGYREATTTHAPLSCAGFQAVVLWHPTETGAATLAAEVQSAAPDAYLLVLTHQRLSVTLGERCLLSNSELRLRSDIAAVSEVSTT